MNIAVKAENYWRDVGRPSSCNASQLPRFLAGQFFIIYCRLITHSFSVISEEIAISHIFTETRFYMGYIPVGDSIGLTLVTVT